MVGRGMVMVGGEVGVKGGDEWLVVVPAKLLLAAPVLHRL